jgi:hypothetical protein
MAPRSPCVSDLDHNHDPPCGYDVFPTLRGMSRCLLLKARHRANPSAQRKRFASLLLTPSAHRAPSAPSRLRPDAARGIAALGLRRALPAVTPCAPPQDDAECGLHVPVPVLRSYVTTPGTGHINAAYHSQRPTHRLLPSIARYASDGGTADA